MHYKVVSAPAARKRSRERGECRIAFNEFELGKDVNRIYHRLALIEAQLKRVSEAAGVPYDDPADGVPPAVAELSRKGIASAPSSSTAS